MKTRLFPEAVADYAPELRSKFSLTVLFDPEDQLKKPMTTLLESAGHLLGHQTAVVTESRVAEVPS